MCILWYKFSVVVIHTKKNHNSLMLVGGKHFSMASVFYRSTVTPYGVTVYPKYSNLYTPRQHLFILAFKECFHS